MKLLFLFKMKTKIYISREQNKNKRILGYSRMLKQLYPIILFAYNRPWHTEQVLIALKNNQLADQSHLIIFVDGPKDTATPEQRRNIEEVRQVVHKEKWCGSVEYHIAETNIGCRNSIIQGISMVLEKHEAAIVLEDDIVTSPYFLKYMNLTLNYYKERKSVFSVSGVTLPEKNSVCLMIMPMMFLPRIVN